MMMLGASIGMIGQVGAGITLVRLAQAKRAMAGDRQNLVIATFYYMYLILLFALTTAVGICVLVFGAVVGFHMAAWAPALPGALLIGTALTAGYIRWRLMRLRAGHEIPC
jgi:hypothetical protein